MNELPSNKADETLPKEEAASEPETMSIRSGSMTPFAGWVFCNGTIVSWEIFVVPCSVDPAMDSSEQKTRQTGENSFTYLRPGNSVPKRQK
jgi:hypothetical protein